MRPHVASNPDRQPLISAVVTFFALAFTSLTLLLISASLGDANLGFVDNPLKWLQQLDSSAAFDTLSNAAEVVAAVLAIAITVVAIVVELAANRYSHLITRLFIREPVNLVVLGLFVTTTIQCVWTAATLSEASSVASLPNAGFVVTMVLVTVSLLSLLPYIHFVFTFLSPISVIDRICQNGVRAIRGAKSDSVESAQRRAQDAIDELQDVSRHAIQMGDRGIAMTGVNALTALLYDYESFRDTLPENWFRVTQTVARDADFVALTPDSLASIELNRTWLETKVFRQMNSLMSQSAGGARDVANLIGINTGEIAKEMSANPEMLQLCMRAFNSYLRATINASDVRTAYYLMNQYRDVAEHLMSKGQNEIVLEIADHLGEYGQIAHEAGLSFLLEAATHDVVQLIEFAVTEDGDCVDALLDVLLELDQEIKEESQEESLLGVRRSQIQLVTLFLMLNQTARAQRIIEDLRGERLERLIRLREGLKNDNRPQYWELTDRGANFRYLPPERRPFLEPLFEKLRGG